MEILVSQGARLLAAPASPEGIEPRHLIWRALVYTVWVKKIPLGFSGISPQTVGNFSVKFCMPYMFLYLRCITNFLFNYLQLCRSYAILSGATQFTSYAQNVHHWLKRMLAFYAIFHKQLGNFSPNFTRLLHVPIYLECKFLFNYLQLWRNYYAILSATTQSAFRPMVDILSIWWWSRLIWHNFIKVAVTVIK